MRYRDLRKIKNVEVAGSHPVGFWLFGQQCCGAGHFWLWSDFPTRNFLRIMRKNYLNTASGLQKPGAGADQKKNPASQHYFAGSGIIK